MTMTRNRRENTGAIEHDAMPENRSAPATDFIYNQAGTRMNVDQEQLLSLLKQVADGVLKQKILIQELQGRLARLEHLQTVDAVANKTVPDPMYYQRDQITSNAG